MSSVMGKLEQFKDDTLKVRSVDKLLHMAPDYNDVIIVRQKMREIIENQYNVLEKEEKENGRIIPKDSIWYENRIRNLKV